MKFSEFMYEAKASKFGPKVTLFNDIAKEMGTKGITWKGISSELAESAIEEAVSHWNTHETGSVNATRYPNDDDMGLNQKAKRIQNKLGKMASDPHVVPMMKRYFDAVRVIAEIGEQAEAYGKTIYMLEIYMSMMNSVAKGDSTHPTYNEAKTAFVRAAMKKLGMTQL